MLISYVVIKYARYESLTTRKADNQAPLKSPHTSSIGCTLTFTDKLVQKEDKPLSH